MVWVDAAEEESDGDFNKIIKGVITMPKGDGTGPKGKGPKTGNRQGACNTADKTFKPQGRGGRRSDKGAGKGRGAGQGGDRRLSS